MYSGHIRQRKQKNGKASYQLVFEGDRDPSTGKRARRYETFGGSKRDAEKMLNQRLYELNNGVVPIKPCSMKLGDWMLEWYRLYTTNLSPTTRSGYLQQINFRIVKPLGNVPLSGLTTNMVQAWVNAMSNEGLSPQSIKNVFLNLKTAMTVAKKQKKIADNPCEDVVLPQVKPYKAQVYNFQQIQSLIATAKDTDMYLIVVIEISLGIRKGEIAALRWSDVDLENGVVHITESRVKAEKKVITKAPKSEAGIRDIWLGEETLNIFKAEHEKYLIEAQSPNFNDLGYVIHKEDGNPYVPDSISQKWKRFRDTNKLQKIRFHDLRHTCATAMIANGVDPKTVQTRMGHSDIQVTLNTYSHCLPTMNKAAGNTMDLLFKS